MKFNINKTVLAMWYGADTPQKKAQMEKLKEKLTSRKPKGEYVLEDNIYKFKQI